MEVEDDQEQDEWFTWRGRGPLRCRKGKRGLVEKGAKQNNPPIWKLVKCPGDTQTKTECNKARRTVYWLTKSGSWTRLVVATLWWRKRENKRNIPANCNAGSWQVANYFQLLLRWSLEAKFCRSPSRESVEQQFRLQYNCWWGALWEFLVAHLSLHLRKVHYNLPLKLPVAEKEWLGSESTRSGKWATRVVIIPPWSMDMPCGRVLTGSGLLSAWKLQGRWGKSELEFLNCSLS